MTIRWKAVERYFTMMLFIFQYSPVFNFGKFISFDFEMTDWSLWLPSMTDWPDLDSLAQKLKTIRSNSFLISYHLPS